VLEGTHEEGEDSSFQTLMFQNFYKHLQYDVVMKLFLLINRDDPKTVIVLAMKINLSLLPLISADGSKYGI